jgi:hypothetical protein
VRAGLVSIVLPAWNGAAMIRESIDSILAQTHARFELIVVNDGSTDETGAIADELRTAGSACPRDSSGQPEASCGAVAGFEAAKGEFLSWTSCDQPVEAGRDRPSHGLPGPPP